MACDATSSPKHDTCRNAQRLHQLTTCENRALYQRVSPLVSRNAQEETAGQWKQKLQQKHLVKSWAEFGCSKRGQRRHGAINGKDICRLHLAKAVLLLWDPMQSIAARKDNSAKQQQFGV